MDCAPTSSRCCAQRSDNSSRPYGLACALVLALRSTVHRSSRSAEARPAMRYVVFAAALSVLACTPAKGSQAPAPKVSAAGDSAHLKDSSTTKAGRGALSTPNADPFPSTYKPFPSKTTVIKNVTILTAAGPAHHERRDSAQGREDRGGGRERERAGGCRRDRRQRKVRHAGIHRHSLAPRRLLRAGRRGEQRRQRGDAPRDRATCGPSIRCGRRIRSSRAISRAASRRCRCFPAPRI